MTIEYEPGVNKNLVWTVGAMLFGLIMWRDECERELQTWDFKINKKAASKLEIISLVEPSVTSKTECMSFLLFTIDIIYMYDIIVNQPQVG